MYPSTPSNSKEERLVAGVFHKVAVLISHSQESRLKNKQTNQQTKHTSKHHTHKDVNLSIYTVTKSECACACVCVYGGEGAGGCQYVCVRVNACVRACVRAGMAGWCVCACTCMCTCAYIVCVLISCVCVCVCLCVCARARLIAHNSPLNLCSLCVPWSFLSLRILLWQNVWPKRNHYVLYSIMQCWR